MKCRVVVASKTAMMPTGDKAVLEPLCLFCEAEKVWQGRFGGSGWELSEGRRACTMFGTPSTTPGKETDVDSTPGLFVFAHINCIMHCSLEKLCKATECRPSESGICRICLDVEPAIHSAISLAAWCGGQPLTAWKALTDAKKCASLKPEWSKVGGEYACGMFKQWPTLHD